MGHTAKTSPFAPATLPEMPVIEGVRFATAAAGIKYKGRTDLLMVVLDEGTTVGGVLTQSKTRSAAVEWCVNNLKHGRARALVVNSGNANAFTGLKGRQAVNVTAEHAVKAVNCGLDEIYQSSTGVIGEPLDASKFAHLLAGLAASAKPGLWHEAARAIMTTDTFPKLATRQVKLGAAGITISGFAKGAGMIAPDLATMLVYIFTDAPVAAPVLQGLLASGAKTTFNCITVDSDTSTSDTVLAFATGAAKKRGVAEITNAASPEGKAFGAGLHDLMKELALLVVKDGEGITKFVTIQVTGAENDVAAKTIGKAIADSPLVKTAIAGEDPNWGRVVMAVGKAGEAADRDKLAIWIGGIPVARHGERVPGYDETPVATHMKGSDIMLKVDVGIARGTATVWTCDLTHEYISINADYRS